MAYVRHTWKNNSEPYLNANNLNEMEAGIAIGVRKQDALTFDGRYKEGENPVATKSTVTNAINELDVSIEELSASETLKSLSEVDGKISAKFQKIEIKKNQITDYDGTHVVANPSNINSGTQLRYLQVGETNYRSFSYGTTLPESGTEGDLFFQI